MKIGKIIGYTLIAIFLVWLLYRIVTGQTLLAWDKNIIGLWIGAFLTISIFSFLYKDNPFYKIAENIFVGVSAAYFMAQAFWSIIMGNCLPKLMPNVVEKIIPGISIKTNYWYIIPLILGVLLLTRLTKKYSWLSRSTLAYVVGFSAGLNFIGFLISDFMSQIKSLMTPIVVMNNGSLDILATFSAIVLVTGALSVLIYFFFSKEHKGAFGAVSRYGIWILMITFGASFGYTVMGRIALLIGRCQFLINDWLNIGV